MLTTRVTKTTTGPAPPVEVTVIFPEYVFGVSPVGFTVTPSWPGVLPLVGVTASHDGVIVPVSTTVVNPTDPIELAIFSACAAGTAPPVWKLKANAEGKAVS